jgi:ElaA protein
MIGAQCYLTGFYQQFGFENVGDDYLEDGIPHQDMCLK